MSTITNIIVAVTALLAIVGVYLYTTTGSIGPLDFSPAGVSQDAVASTEQFVFRRQILDQIELNFDLFDNPAFFRTVGFTEPVGSYPIGRNNIFDPVEEADVESAVLDSVNETASQ